MIKLSQYKFKSRLIIGFSIIIVFNVLTVVLSIQKIKDIGSDLKRIYNHPLAVSNTVREINSNINAIHKIMKDVVLSENKDQLKSEIKLISEYDEKIHIAFKLIHDKFLGDKLDVNLAYKSYLDWEKIRIEVITLMLDGKRLEATQITRGREAEHVDVLFDHTQIIIDFARLKADELYLVNIEEEKKTKATLISILLLILSLSIIVAFIIANSISLPIKRLINRIHNSYGYNTESIQAKNSTNEQEMLDNSVTLIEKLSSELKKLNTTLENKVEKRTEELKISEQKFRTLFENMTEAFALHKVVQDKQNKVVNYTFIEMNSAFELQTGAIKDKAINKLVTEVFPGIENDPANWIEKYGEVALSGTPLKFEQYSDTIQKWYSILVFSPSPGYFATLFNDITEIKKSEQAISQYGKIIETSLNEIYIVDAMSCKFIQANKGARMNIGYSLEELEKMTILDISPKFDEKSFDELIKPLNDKTQEKINFTTEYKRNDGTKYPVEIYLQKSLFNFTPVYIAFVTDITKRIKDESELIEKNNSLQDMVYIASHDLQVPLVSMEGYASELLQNNKDKLDEESLYCLNRLQNNAQRMHKLVLSLLDISRLETQKFVHKKVNLNKLLAKILGDLSLTIENAKAKVICMNLKNINADKERIEIVFRNLILNSINYQGKKIKIGFSNQTFFVEDDGVGIPPSQLEKVFKPGERLKTIKTDGVGMGLTFCKKVIEQHNGIIWAESEGNNKGTTIFFKFNNEVLID